MPSPQDRRCCHTAVQWECASRNSPRPLRLGEPLGRSWTGSQQEEVISSPGQAVWYEVCQKDQVQLDDYVAHLKDVGTAKRVRQRPPFCALPHSPPPPIPIQLLHDPGEYFSAEVHTGVPMTKRMLSPQVPSASSRAPLGGVSTAVGDAGAEAAAVRGVEETWQNTNAVLASSNSANGSNGTHSELQLQPAEQH